MHILYTMSSKTNYNVMDMMDNILLLYINLCLRFEHSKSVKENVTKNVTYQNDTLLIFVFGAMIQTWWTFKITKITESEKKL